jgi:integrase
MRFFKPSKYDQSFQNAKPCGTFMVPFTKPSEPNRKAVPKLTKRYVEKLEPSPSDDYVAWDDELPGFGVRVWPSGKRSYVLKYRTSSGRQRKATIGPHGVLTAEQARKRALNWLSEAKLGGDPAGTLSQDRKVGTVTDLAKQYMETHAKQKKKLLSQEADERSLRLHILPRIGSLNVKEVSRADIAQLHHSMRKSPIAANRVIALLSKMFNLAEKWDLREDGTNPCRHIEKFKENKRERFLSEAELARLAEVLEDAERTCTEMPSVIAAIRLLLFTGARLSEILTLRWDQVDMEGSCLRLPESKTGAKTIYLSPPAREVLANLEQHDDNPYVIAGVKPGAHLVNLQKPWGRIRNRAGLDNVRIHDLRHSFASMAVAGGLSLPVIGALLGHTQPATTARYAHLAADPLKQAANLTGSRIAAAMALRTRRDTESN